MPLRTLGTIVSIEKEIKKQIAGNYIWYLIIIYYGKESEKEYIYIYMYNWITLMYTRSKKSLTKI